METFPPGSGAFVLVDPTPPSPPRRSIELMDDHDREHQKEQAIATLLTWYGHAVEEAVKAHENTQPSERLAAMVQVLSENEAKSMLQVAIAQHAIQRVDSRTPGPNPALN